MIRALVADDSPTARALLVEILRADPDIEVVGEARNGAEAVAMTAHLRPDVVTMDIQMPGMDGYAATKQIMSEVPTPIVIVSGNVDVSEVSVSLRALRAGALTLVNKPPGPGAPDFERVCRDLARLVKAMAQVKVVRLRAERRDAATAAHLLSGLTPVPTPVPTPRPTPSLATGTPPRVVAIAASTGGPAALHRVVSELPADFPLPVLVVQHLAPGFMGGLATWLDSASPCRVKIAEDGEPLAPGTVYLAPDERHLGLRSASAVQLADAPPIGGFRPSASHLFASVAGALQGAAVGVVLTGMGNDGVDGLRALRAAGGRVLAQDEPTSVVFGMPGAAIAAGLADLVLPISDVAPYLRLITHGRR